MSIFVPVPPLGETFPATLEAARAGSGWAFEQLFRSLAMPVTGYLRAQGLADPDGGVNDVFLRVFRSLGTFEGPEEKFRSWVFTIAHHLVIDERRAQGRRPATSELSDDLVHSGAAGAGPGDDADRFLGDDRIRRLLDQLPATQRDVLLLRIISDLSIEDVAGLVGRRPGAVKALQRRGLGALRRLLEHESVARGVSP